MKIPKSNWISDPILIAEPTAILELMLKIVPIPIRESIRIPESTPNPEPIPGQITSDYVSEAYVSTSTMQVQYSPRFVHRDRFFEVLSHAI